MTADLGQSHFWKADERRQEREQAQRDWDDAKNGQRRGYGGTHESSHGGYANFNDFFNENRSRQRRTYGDSMRDHRTSSASSGHYAVLGLSSSASQQEAKVAYRALMKKHHPDLNPGNREAATEKTQQINAAYEAICKAKGW